MKTSKIIRVLKKALPWFATGAAIVTIVLAVVTVIPAIAIAEAAIVVGLVFAGLAAWEAYRNFDREEADLAQSQKDAQEARERLRDIERQLQEMTVLEKAQLQWQLEHLEQLQLRGEEIHIPFGEVEAKEEVLSVKGHQQGSSAFFRPVPDSRTVPEENKKAFSRAMSAFGKNGLFSRPAKNDAVFAKEKEAAPRLPAVS